MKYRDLLTVFLSIVFLLTLAYAIGVNIKYWYAPVVMFIILIFFVYKLWIEK